MKKRYSKIIETAYLKILSKQLLEVQSYWSRPDMGNPNSIYEEIIFKNYSINYVRTGLEQKLFLNSKQFKFIKYLHKEAQENIFNYLVEKLQSIIDLNKFKSIENLKIIFHYTPYGDWILKNKKVYFEPWSKNVI